MNVEPVRYPRYRWVILGVAWVTLMCIFWSWYLIPSLAYCLFPELGLTHMQFTLILTGPILIAIFTAILGGALADRYGIRSTMIIAAFLAGALGLARASTPSFGGMFVLMCLFGIPVGFAMVNLPKLIGIWFPPRQTGLASGIFTSGMAVGSSLGLLTGPLFGGWRPAFTYVAIVMLVVAVLWTIFARNAPKGIEIHRPPMVAGIKRGARSKNIWFAAIALFLLLGGFISFSGNFPKALESVHHVAPGTAGAITSLLTWGLVAGSFLFPMLSDRVGFRKPFIYVGAVASAVCLFFAWHLAPSAATSVLCFVGGLMLGGAPPLVFATLVELPEIGHAYVGGASGLVISLQQMGGVLLPLLVVTPIIAAGTLGAYTNGFLVAIILFAAIALPTIFLKETGARATK